MSLRSSSQRLSVHRSNAIGSSRESNPSRRICNLRGTSRPGVGKLFTQRATLEEILKPRAALIG